jgi:broad specificity phosphatase PhoE
MARWVLVRHGETAWNVEERIQGWTDVPLHDVGRREASLTAARLAEFRFVAAYSSDMERTQETARIILDAQDSGGPALQTDAALREISFGAYEGMTWEQMREREPRMADREVVRHLDFTPEDGESFRQLLERTGAFATTFRQRHAADDVLVVAHGGSLRALTVRLLGLPDEMVWQLRGLHSASISIVSQGVPRGGDPPALTAWNDWGHLA